MRIGLPRFLCPGDDLTDRQGVRKSLSLSPREIRGFKALDCRGFAFLNLLMFTKSERNGIRQGLEKKMLVIVDYGAGNLTSIRNMLKKAGYRKALISSAPEDLQEATKLILPGGAFDYGIKQLNQSGLRQKLEEKVFEDKISILGICSGAQLTKRSDEGKEDGLGWIDGETVAFERDRLSSNLRVPHMGWADVPPKDNTHS